jgi:hypothetical protein
VSNFSHGTDRQPEITTLFGPPRTGDETEPSPPDERFAITRKSLGKTLVVLAALPFLWGTYVGAYHHWHPPARWTHTTATILDGRIRMTRNICPAGWHSVISENTVANCDYYVFGFGVSYLVAGKTQQSKLDSPPFIQKREAEAWASQLTPGHPLAIIYDQLDAGRVRRADDPSPGQYSVGPSIGYYPVGIGGPEVVIESATGPLGVAFCLLVPGILLIASSRSKRRDLHNEPAPWLS